MSHPYPIWTLSYEKQQDPHLFSAIFALFFFLLDLPLNYSYCCNKCVITNKPAIKDSKYLNVKKAIENTIDAVFLTVLT